MTFEEYVEQRWDMQVRRVNQMIECAVAAAELENGKNFSQFPTKESQVRELLKLDTDQQRAEVWQRVVERQPGAQRGGEGSAEE